MTLLVSSCNTDEKYLESYIKSGAHETIQASGILRYWSPTFQVKKEYALGKIDDTEYEVREKDLSKNTYFTLESNSIKNIESAELIIHNESYTASLIQPEMRGMGNSVIHLFFPLPCPKQDFTVKLKDWKGKRYEYAITTQQIEKLP